MADAAIGTRTRHEIETTQRAGILDADAARALIETGVCDRILHDGYEHVDGYQPRALQRVWRAQNFSYWMTQLLHTAPGSTPFGLQHQLGEPDNVVGTRAGRTYLAAQYTGWPTRTPGRARRPTGDNA